MSRISVTENAKLTLERCERCGAMDVYLHGDTLRCHCCGRTENPISTLRREERRRGRFDRPDERP